MTLVRAALWGKEKAVWSVEQTEELLWLNAMQGTGALVYPLVLGQDDLPAKVAMQMKGVCVHTMQQQVHLQHTLVQAWEALTKAGIEPVLMKGAGLAALYPEMQLRAWGDIDLFVGKELYHPACKVMRDTFPDALKFDEELDHYKHYNIIADGVSIETHRVTVGLQHPLDEKRYARMEAYGTEKSERLTVNGLEVKVFEPTFNALFVFMHAWEHMLTAGANLRQWCDLALLLHRYHERIDARLLERWLKQLRLLDVWQLYAYNMLNGLGLPREECLLYSERVAERAERMLEDLLEGDRGKDEGRFATGRRKRLQDNGEGLKVKGESLKVNGERMKGEGKKANRFVRKWGTMKERLKNAERIGRWSPEYARHMRAETLLHGALRLFAKDRRWE